MGLFDTQNGNWELRGSESYTYGTLMMWIRIPFATHVVLFGFPFVVLAKLPKNHNVILSPFLCIAFLKIFAVFCMSFAFLMHFFCVPFAVLMHFFCIFLSFAFLLPVLCISFACPLRILCISFAFLFCISFAFFNVLYRMHGFKGETQAFEIKMHAFFKAYQKCNWNAS